MKKIILFFLLSVILTAAYAQPERFASEIEQFKKLDSLQAPPKNAILFIGSSTFTKWKDVQDYFPTHPIINRGFGGSTLPDVIHYVADVVFPYQPRQVVIYCGENDVAAGTTPVVVLARVQQLVELIRSRYPRVPIAFMSLKPSPSREKFLAAVVEVNTLVSEWLKKQKRASFINIYNVMLNADGSFRKELFLEDNLHMNAKGYAIWQKIMEPYLK